MTSSPDLRDVMLEFYRRLLAGEADGSVAVPDDECVMLQRRWTYGIPGPS